MVLNKTFTELAHLPFAFITLIILKFLTMVRIEYKTNTKQTKKTTQTEIRFPMLKESSNTAIESKTICQIATAQNKFN